MRNTVSSRKGRSPCLARRRMRGNQGQQIGPGDHLLHLIEERSLTRALGGQLESALGKADLLHPCSMFERLSWETYADVP